jgi:flagellar motor switch protein FliM
MIKNQQQNLLKLHEEPALLVHTHYTDINDPVADVDIAFVDQTTYAEFVVSLSNPPASFTFKVEALGDGSVTLD